MTGACCYPKAARLRRRSEYLAVQENGRRRHTPRFVLLSSRDPARAGARLGLTVSGRVGGAVTRNRIKRQVREVFRQGRPLLAPDLVLVVIAKPAAAGARTAELAAELRGALAGE